MRSQFRLSLVVLFVSMAVFCSTLKDYRTYIIHMDKSMMPAPFSTHHSWYMSTLSSLEKDGISPAHLYTYNHVMDGFSAVLSYKHVEQLQGMSGHLATFNESFGHRHTTHTPVFLGLSKHIGLWPTSGFGDDMIIGILDSGIWPESRSFSDQGMSPVSSRWRGACETGVDFNSSNCNKKLIGARSFSKGMKKEMNISKTDDYDSPRDFWGHGTHTSSTAAGNRAPFADYFGYAKGTASGIAPKARLAMYKVLFANSSYDAAASDTLAGMDQAIEDGVDLMSLSLAFPETTPFYKNPIALGAFAAMEKGIFVACSAGNGGPHGYTVFNGAPWITTVGAGTVDREFRADVTLGEGTVFASGKSIYPENLLVSRVPIYYGHGNKSKEVCRAYSLEPKEVEGKYIFCDFSNDPIVDADPLFEMNRTGAAGAIYVSDEAQFLAPKDFNLPYVVMNRKYGDLVKDYLTRTDDPTVSIKFQGTKLGTKPAPQVAFFSSRGPDERSPWILKPDILAPGVDILAAWAPNRASALIRDDDYLLTDYTLSSGTSMSCPHIGGVAALLKATHRDWSSAAIRSAMMTTADIFDNSNGAIIDMTTGVAGTPLDYGAGHVNPNKAMDPGLVYDIKPEDYISYLCAMNYTRDEIMLFARRPDFSCENSTLDLNYPSFIVILNKTKTATYTFNRVLTNTVDASSSYRAVISTPSTGMSVVVQPSTISFSGKYSTAEFNMTVTIDLSLSPQSDYFGNYGYLSWNEINGKHVVRSTIVSARASPRT
ncbi:subtilisin-like protease SBT1.7 [Apium graveolens]|uniref:subtilisin-like protease SBT1.7 n=1 Tax=Apium graveolens TaxID=4045 RepID=UPI003D796B88